MRIIFQKKYINLFLVCFLTLLLLIATLNKTESVPFELIQTSKVILPDKINLKPNLEKVINLPTRLVIPGIKVDANVTHLGLTPDGAMASPKDIKDVAWYEKGPKPGAIGSAVVAGHKTWSNNSPAVFDNLHLLAKGDFVYIKGDEGESLTFVVRETKIYKPQDDATEVFISDTGVSLNLITCAGDWDNAKKTATDRLVIFTSLVY